MINSGFRGDEPGPDYLWGKGSEATSLALELDLGLQANQSLGKLALPIGLQHFTFYKCTYVFS